MFRRLISNISFSPALVGQLGFYARRLRKEESTRRVGLIFTALALVVQSFAVFSPPESANAASSGDLVRGGLHSRTELLNAYDNNTQGIRELFDHAKINRASLANATFGQIHSRVNGKDAGWLSWNRTARFGLQRGETSMTVGKQQIYVRPLAAFDVKNTTGSGSWYPAFYGTTTDGKPFAFMTDCANILLKYRPPSTKTAKPAYACEQISSKKITRTTYDFGARSSWKNGASPTGFTFNFGDGSSKTVGPTSGLTRHTYTKPGTYTVTVTALFKANGKNVSATSPSCKTTVNVDSAPTPTPVPKPVAYCTALQAKKITRTRVSLTATNTTRNGATIKSATFVVKDTSGKEVLSRTVNTTNRTVTTEVELSAAGAYSAAVTFTTSVGAKTSSDCQTEIVIEEIAPCPVNPSLPINSPECQPCVGDDDLWYKDEACKAKILRTKSAQNITHDTDAEKIVAKGDDRITYTLSVKNEGVASAEFTIEDDLSDVLEYATIQNTGGGAYDKEAAKITWPKVTLKPGETQTRMYTVKLPKEVPAAPQGTSDPSSYDCRMTNVFGNTVDVEVDCPTPKVVEQTVKELPYTGPRENILFAGVVFAVVAYFYARSRQLKTEVRLIRRSVNSGTI